MANRQRDVVLRSAQVSALSKNFSLDWIGLDWIGPTRMSCDMSGPMSGMPTGTTNTAHVANTCVPAGQSPNKMPIFITGFADTRAFLVWLRAFCPCDLTAQLKAEKLMAVQSTTDGFRATVSAQ
jgi:hypothetical protein